MFLHRFKSTRTLILLAVILAIAPTAFQTAAGETLYPSGYDISSQYSINAGRILAGDTLVINREVINNENFNLSDLYFSENAPPEFDVVDAMANINGASIAFESFGPLSILIGSTPEEYKRYTWVIDKPDDDITDNILKPGDSVILKLKLVCDSIGEYTFPLHTTVFYGNNQGFFSTSDSIRIEIVSSMDEDTIPPEFVQTCPSDTTIECGPAPAPPVMTAVDDIDTDVNVVFDETIDGNIITRTWTATDDAGNSTRCMQVIAIIDTLSPVITCPGDMQLECGSSIDPEYAGYPVFSDNCGAGMTLSYNDVYNGNIISRTWTVTDAAGNSAQCLQKLIVDDTQAPVFVEACPPNTTVECDAIPDPPEMAASDNCDMDVDVVFDEIINGGVIMRTWTASDDAGNSAQCVQIITIADTQAPAFVEACPLDATVACDAVPDPPVLTAVDNCDAGVNVAYNEVINGDVITRTWTATDDAGNSVPCVQTITVVDTFAPVFVEACPPDTTVNYDAIPDPAVMTAVDNCDADVSVAYDEIINGDIITRTWTATDDTGNSAQCLQTITVIPKPQVLSKIYGQVTSDGVGLFNAYVSLYDNDENHLSQIATDEDGLYLFDELPDGDYIVRLLTPLGFIPVTDTIVNVTIDAYDVEVNIELTDPVVTSWAYNYWWWLRQFTYIQRGGVYESLAEFTRADVEEYSQALFGHFYDRDDGYEIRIDSVTYIDNPARPLTYAEMSNTFLGTSANDDNTQIKRSLRANMLNIASGKLSQYAVVSVDGATASQALIYFTGLFLSGGQSNLYTANVNLQRMHMRIMIPAGVIPLTTPNIVFKGSGENDTADDPIPHGFSLGQNFPNPFNPITEIGFVLPRASHVTLEVYNMAGRKVSTVVDRAYPKGYHSIVWDGAAFGSGMYLYKIEADGFTDSKKMVLLK